MPPAPNKWLITVSVMVPTLIEVLDTSVANVSLKHIQGSLSAGQEEVTWVLTSYLVANAVVIPMSGWLARLFGRKRYLLASLAVFTLASLMCGAATSLSALIFFRIVQGIGGGGLQPMSQAILLETFPPEKRGLAMGVFGMGVVVGPILGPLLGGWLTDTASWRWIFYVNLPVGLIALVMITANVFDPPYQIRHAKSQKVDYLGLTLLCLGIGSLQIVLDKGQQDDWFESSFILALTIIAAVSLIGLIWWELRHKNPIINLRIFKDRSFAVGNTVMFLGFFAFFGSVVLLPLFLQNLMGYTAFWAGLVLGPGGAVTLLMLPLIGRATERIDARILLATGLLVNSYSLYYMAGFNLDIGLFHGILGRTMQGIGMPFFFVSLTFLTMAWVPREQMNDASAIFNLLRNLGGSFGVAFVTTLLARRTQIHHSRLIEHVTQFDPGFTFRLEELKQALALKLGGLADHTQAALGIIYRELNRQAAALAFNDVFFYQSLIFLGLAGLVVIMQKPPLGKGPGPGAH